MYKKCSSAPASFSKPTNENSVWIVVGWLTGGGDCEEWEKCRDEIEKWRIAHFTFYPLSSSWCKKVYNKHKFNGLVQAFSHSSSNSPG